MAKRLVVAVGGTGQMALHYYLQLYLLGLIAEPFDALVLDSDNLIDVLRTAQRFLRSVAAATHEPISEIKCLRVQAGAAGAANVCGALSGHDSWPTFHPVHAYFDRDTLSMGIARGLYARPALSTLIAYSDSDFANAFSPEQTSTTVVVGSLLGGTGGGIIAPAIASSAGIMESRQCTGAVIRGVFLGNFFQPNRDLFPDADERFESNKILAAKTLQQLAPSRLELFIFIEPTVKMQRQDETLVKNPPWPAPEEGYWLAVQAIQEMFDNSIKPTAKDFTERQFEADYTKRLPHGSAQQALFRKLSIVNDFLSRKVLEKIADEPFVRWVWGRRLPELIEGFYRPASQRSPELKGTPTKFAKELQAGITEQWGSLSAVFPLVRQSIAVRPSMIRNAKWGELTEDAPSDLFSNLKEGQNSAAAYLLFSLLRGAIE